METSRKYSVAVVFLAVLAVAFGVFGTVAPPLAETSTPVQPQQESPSESLGHFQNPPSYDSWWVDISTKPGQYVTLKHDLNTTDMVVDISGRMSLDPMSGDLAWSKVYGGTQSDISNSLVQTDDGGYALAGYTYSYDVGNGDFWLVEADSTGSVLWNQTYGGTDEDRAFSMVQTSDGGYALAGYTWSYDLGNGDFWLVKTGAAGNMLWNQTYGGTDEDIALSLVQTGDGGYALAGRTGDYYGAGSWDVWFVRTDSAGNHLWDKTYGGPYVDGVCSVIRTVDGGYALAGYTNSSGTGGYDFWLVKTDADGNPMWNQTYGGTGDDVATSLVQIGDGGYALAGYTDSYGAGADDFWLVKTDADGVLQWSQTYGGTGFDTAHSVVQSGDGGYAIAGQTWSGGGAGYDSWLIKTDDVGVMQWSRTYGGTDFDAARSLVQTGDGGYALAGFILPFGAGWEDAWLVKVKAEMNLEHKKHFGGTNLITGWSRTYGGTYHDKAFSVVLTGDGGYELFGQTRSYSAYDFLLVKTDSAGVMQWNQTYGGAGGFEEAFSVVQTVDGGYAVAGYTNSYGAGDSDFWLVKTNSAGVMQWNRTYGGTSTDIARSLVQTNDGGYALAGYTGSFGAGNYDLWLVKTDSAGIFQWGITYGGTDADYAHSLVQTGDGGYAIAGSTGSYGAGSSADFWLVKTDSSGLARWNRTYGGTDHEIAYSAVQTGDGGYALAGYTWSYGAGGTDFWLVKTDGAGNAQWSRTYGGAGDDAAYSIIQTSDEGYAIAGETYSFGAVGGDFWMAKTDLAGRVQWSRAYGEATQDVAFSVVQTDDGGYALAGSTASYGAGGYDFWLVKSDVESGLAQTGLTSNSITLYRGSTDLYWNYVRVRMWLIKEPSWIYGDINMDGIVDAKDLYIVGRNYGKTFSLLSLGGIFAIAGVRTVKKRKQSRRLDYIS